MGKGDKKTKKGKIIQGSYGVSRPRKDSVKYTATTTVKAEGDQEEPVAKSKVTKKTKEE